MPELKVLGIDFDNTIIDYRQVFPQLVREMNLPVPEGMIEKKAIRDHLRQLPGGEIAWQKLQAQAYGPQIGRAQLFPGLVECLRAVRQKNLPVYVVSHKSEFAAQDNGGVSLRKASLQWLQDNGLFVAGLLTPEQVFFESTRHEKVARIAALGCSHFVDDLEETFVEPGFPNETEKILLDPAAAALETVAEHCLPDWTAIARCLLTVETDVGATLSRLLGERPLGWQQLSGGKNSQVYRVERAGQAAVVAKFYFRHPQDPRDRLRTEFDSLQFLWQAGLRCIPEPLLSDPQSGCALYGHVAGELLANRSVGTAEIDQLVAFLAQLKRLTAAAHSRQLASASEAFFSPQASYENLQRRLRRLSEFEQSTPAYEALRQFLLGGLLPFTTQVAEKLRALDGGAWWTAELPQEKRTLSPADYGFHNALRAEDGQLAFLDFEYFGWDEPARQIADFVLHPAIKLSDEQRRYFVQQMFAVRADMPELPERFRRLYPLVGSVWCTIFLNEFIPAEWQRRNFSGQEDADQEQRRFKQLAKAQQMLARLKTEYEQFPYET